jgi:trans-aconitate 2-methyltransferase
MEPFPLASGGNFSSVGTWSAEQYLKFEDERTRPARDLLNGVPLDAPRTVVDVGCGPGNSTELLVERYPQAAVSGFDSSAEMLVAARKRLPGVTFTEGDVATWTPTVPPDLIFANAVFQWVPDHGAVLARLAGTLAPGGVLAVQMPDNLDEPSHRAIRDTAAENEFAEAFRVPVSREALRPVGSYYDALKPIAARVEIWRTTYHHALAGADAIVEWVKGTGLRPYLDRLDAAQQTAYLARYTERLAAAYPPQADGRVLFRFPRLFIVATK